MALYTKSIFKEKESDDGIRVSVMSRHTLNDGITLDTRITPDSYDEHLAELAPRPKLVGSYYRGLISWNEFEKHYIEQIKNTEEINNLAKRAIRQDLTLLCVEDLPDNCHRKILAEECRQKQPDLIVKHR